MIQWTYIDEVAIARIWQTDWNNGPAVHIHLYKATEWQWPTIEEQCQIVIRKDEKGLFGYLFNHFEQSNVMSS